LIFAGTYAIKDKIHYSLAFDFFDESLETILELIQGPNLSNQKLAIQHSFVEVAKEVLEKYSKNFY
jgi:hypothetical protein